MLVLLGDLYTSNTNSLLLVVDYKILLSFYLQNVCLLCAIFVLSCDKLLCCLVDFFA